jgi:hypothetical protein
MIEPKRFQTRLRGDLQLLQVCHIKPDAHVDALLLKVGHKVIVRELCWAIGIFFSLIGWKHVGTQPSESRGTHHCCRRQKNSDDLDPGTKAPRFCGCPLYVR